MATSTSNLDKVLAQISGLKDKIDLTRPGIHGQGIMAKDAQQIIVVGIMDRFAKQTDPDGQAWPDNSDRAPWHYKTKKAGRPIGVGLDRPATKSRSAHRGGSMASMLEMLGRLEATHNELTIRHGVTPAIARELQWFSNGSSPGIGAGECSGAKGQPPRPFAGLDAEILEKLHTYLNDFLKSAWKA